MFYENAANKETQEISCEFNSYFISVSSAAIHKCIFNSEFTQGRFNMFHFSIKNSSQNFPEVTSYIKTKSVFIGVSNKA